MKERCRSLTERRLVQNKEQNMLSDDSVNAVEMRCLLAKDVFTESVTVKDDERTRDWQCGTNEQELEDEPWKKQTRFKKERRSFRRSRLRRRAQRHGPKKPPLHADDFRPKVPLDLSWEVSDAGGRLPIQACATNAHWQHWPSRQDGLAGAAGNAEVRG